MQARITSQQGRVVEVEFTFDDDSTLTKKMDLQPNDAGDPFDNLELFFKNYALAYLSGKEIETQNQPENLTGTVLNLN